MSTINLPQGFYYDPWHLYGTVHEALMSTVEVPGISYIQPPTAMPRHEVQCGWCRQTYLVEEHTCCPHCGGYREPMR